MPSTFSINKPSKAITLRNHEQRLARKRAARAKAVKPFTPTAASKPDDPKSAAYYKDIIARGTGVITKTLSKKRAQKLERNARFAAKRNQQLALQEGGMEVDMPVIKKEKKQKPESHLEKVRKALRTAVEDSAASSMVMDASGEGTTIGIQAF